MDKLIKIIEYFAPVLLVYPQWVQGLFIITTVLLAFSLTVALILLPSVKKKSSTLSTASSSFTVTQPKSGHFVITRRFSIHGEGADPVENNALKVHLFNVQANSSRLVDGQLVVNSDKTWRFDYVDLEEPGAYNLVVDAIFGSTRHSRTIRVNYEASKLEIASKNLITSVPEDIHRAVNLKLDEGAKDAMQQLVAGGNLAGLSSEAETYYRMGNYFFIEGQFDKAIELYRKTVEINPVHYKAYLNMGEAFQRLGQWENALQAFQGAQANQDIRNRASSMVNVATTYVSRERYEDALSELQKVIDIDPLYSHAYFLAGEVSERMGRKSDAVRYYKQFLHLGGTSDPGLYKHYNQEIRNRINHLERSNQ